MPCTRSTTPSIRFSGQWLPASGLQASPGPACTGTAAARSGTVVLRLPPSAVTPDTTLRGGGGVTQIPPAAPITRVIRATETGDGVARPHRRPRSQLTTDRYQLASRHGAHNPADLRGHRLDADHYADRPDLDILCAGESVGTGIGDLLYRVCWTGARGRSSFTWLAPSQRGSHPGIAPPRLLGALGLAAVSWGHRRVIPVSNDWDRVYPLGWSLPTGGSSCTCCLVMLSWTPSWLTAVAAGDRDGDLLAASQVARL